MKSAFSTRDLLAALQLPKVGPSTVRKLWSANGSQLEAGLVAQIEAFQGKRGIPLSQSHLSGAYEKADEIIDQSRRYSVRVLSPADDAYPRALLDLPDYPPIIYVKGTLETLANPKKLAVVGTREASELGLKLARKIASELSNLRICVVSGLALGIDSAAHQGAVRGEGSTIAVLAHGLDQIAPKSNESLASSILESNGVLLSEHEIGIIPRGPQFVARNRLQSGLSRGSIVVESGFTGGSIYQGKFTREQGRLLFVVVPDPSLPGASEFNKEGGDRLQREFGAQKISRLQDILQAIPEFVATGLDTNVVQSHVVKSDSDQANRLSPDQRKVRGAEVREQLSLSDAYEAEVKSGLAVHHRNAAEFFAEQATMLERSAEPSERTPEQCRSYALGAVFCAVAFLEAMINEIYLSAVDGPHSAHFADFLKAEAVAKEWVSPPNPRWSLMDKYERILKVSGSEEYGNADRLRNDVASLIHLRNSLVHYKPEWDTKPKRHKDVETRLAGKFAENLFSAPTQAFFPHRCLGAGCARWAVSIATEFALDVRARLGLSDAITIDQALVRQKTA